MAILPQLTEDDIQKLDATLREFITSTDASAALVIDEGGFLITQQGDMSGFDLASIGALASGAFMANQAIANLVNEKNFSCTYQQGENFSLFVTNVDEHCMLIVIFKSATGLGVVKYHAANTIKHIARQLKISRKRAPGEGIDLSTLNIADTQDVFRRKDSGSKKRR
jgi:predicted regulator of Ras-like GTPase activity (Roadblock/LC7/MglB family)